MLLGLFFHASLGLIFALCARERLRADGPAASPSFLLVAMYTGFLVVPITFYLYAVHPAWSWMYWVDPDKVPALLLVPIVVGHAAVLLGSFYGGGLLIRADRRPFLMYGAAASGAVAVVGVLVFRGRLGTYASYAGWKHGAGRPLLDVKLGYVLIALVLALGAAGTFVMLELVRDSRRARSR
jgi:hypothetical protein